MPDRYTTRVSLAGVRRGIEHCLSRVSDESRLSRTAPQVSAWSIGAHLEHLLLSDRKVLGWIERAVALPASGSGNGSRGDRPRDIGIALLARGTIPRGRGPAPDFALPAGAGRNDLRRGFASLQALVGGLADRAEEVDACDRTLPHHVLGHFTPTEWLRFLHLHHRHHEAIIRDIRAA